MTQPFFSIITVVYNDENGLEKTAKSLQEQLCRDFEWIVVDGASTDDTLDIANKWADRDRDTVVSEPDKGVYDAMNKGLNLARGKVVQFLNANDWFAGERVLTEIKSAFDDSIDAVYGDTLLSLNDGRMVARDAQEPGATLHKRMPFSHQAVFIRRERHLRHPFDMSFKIAADKAAISGMYMAGAKFHHAKVVTNVNTIEPEAISIAGKVRSASEDYRVSVEILKRPRLEAAFYYLRKRIVIIGVGILESLPQPIFARLPKIIRQRVY